MSQSKVTILSLGLGVAVLLGSNTAHAGFDWTPSPKAQAPVGMHTLKSGQASADQGAEQAGPLTPDPDSAAANSLPVPVGDVQSARLPEKAAPMPVMPEAAPANTEPAIVPLAPEDVATTELPAPAQAADQQAPVQTPEPAAAPAPAENAPVNLTPDTASSQAAQAPAQTSVQTSVPAPTPESAPSAAPSQEPVLQGFGKDIALVLALRDIVPAGYALSFSNPSDAGKRVSWRGGKVWHDVLNDSLAPLGLTHVMTANAVLIQPIGAASPAPVAEAKAAEPQQMAPPVMVETKQEWSARPGSTLREVVESWSKSANVDLQWMSPYDYPINNAFKFVGSYQEAVSTLLGQYGRENPRPRGRLYPNLPTGPSVLLVN